MNLKNDKIIICYSAIVLMIFGLITTASAQQSEETPQLNFQKGSILTGFSAGWTNASRDSYNFEFERSFREFFIGVDALYFVTNRIALGPEVEYRYLYRDLEDPPGSDFDDATDQWTWDTKYGAKAGWFAPVKEIFGTSVLGNSTFFTTGGVNWLRNQRKVEGFERYDPNTRFGYSISTGLVIPLGRQIGLETKLQYAARKRTYGRGIIDENGNIVITQEASAWPSTLSLGIGLKVKF